MSVEQIGKDAKEASIILRATTQEQRLSALKSISKNLLIKKNEIVCENKKDLNQAKSDNLSDAMIDRLMLDEARVDQMAKSVLEVSAQEEVVGKIISEFTRDDGLKVKKQTIPLGTLAMIFESRPNVVIDCSAIAIKSANAIILKGGKEAYHSNKILGEIVSESIKDFIPEKSVQVLDSKDRSSAQELIKLNKYIDVVIPRGGEKLIEYVYENSTIPVIAHFKGLCHIYIHQDADMDKAINIVLNAKTQRPGVCNALESLLLHKSLSQKMIRSLFEKLKSEGIELRLDEKLFSEYEGHSKASEQDWNTEYLDRILSIKMVQDENEAIAHIQKYGTHHTEAIVAKDPKVIEKFLNTIDASCITINSSTRFNDGGQLGLGAELGISTSKIHAYGPMGVAELMTTRYVVEGDGHIRN